jgi:hypothetical protein
MKQSEPVNPRSLRGERNVMCFHGSAIAAEISGYADIGMKNDALRLVRKALEQRRIQSEEFSTAMRTIGILSDFNKWKSKLEAAYNRQPQKFKRKVRPYMLEMYASLGEWEIALRFLSIRRPAGASDMFFGVGVLLELDKLEDARVLAIRCANALRHATSRFEQSLLLDALGSFFARTHSWDHAITAWQDAPLDQPFRQNALSGIVQLHLACAFEAIETGLKALAELKRDPEISLCLPKNELRLTCDAERELLKFKRGIEKLLPEEARKPLGICVAES